MRRLRWSSFALVSAAYVLSYFHRIAPNAIAGELRAAFHASGAELGGLAATYFSVYMVTQVPTGILVDRLGPRRIVAIGGVVAGVGSILFGRAATLGAASAGRTLVGLGVSVTFVSLLKLVAAWFREEEFATLSGVVMLMGNVGALLSATPLAWVSGLTSWRNVFVFVGLSSLAGAALTWLLVRDTPAEAGLPSPHALPAHPGEEPHRGAWWEGLRVVARNPATWPGFFVNFGLAGSFMSFLGLWAGPWLTTFHGMSRTRATAHTTTMILGFAAGSVAVGRLSDALARRRAPAVAFGAVHVACWIPIVLGLPLSPAAGFALFAVMGASAPGFTLSWAAAKEVNPPALSGTAMALVNTGVFLGTAIEQPLAGWVLDRAGFRAAMAVLAVCAAAGLAAAGLVRETRGRNVTTRAADDAAAAARRS